MTPCILRGCLHVLHACQLATHVLVRCSGSMHTSRAHAVRPTLMHTTKDCQWMIIRSCIDSSTQVQLYTAQSVLHSLAECAMEVPFQTQSGSGQLTDIFTGRINGILTCQALYIPELAYRRAAACSLRVQTTVRCQVEGNVRPACQYVRFKHGAHAAPQGCLSYQGCQETHTCQSE